MKTKLLFLFAILVGTHCNVSLQGQELPDTVWSKRLSGCHVIKFSLDDQYIFSGSIDSIFKIDASTGDILNVFCSYARDNHKISFSATGDTIVCSGYQENRNALFALYHSTTLDTIYTMNLGKGETGAETVFSPDGRKIITTTGKMGRGEPQILVIDIATKQIIKTISNNYLLAHNLNFSPNGKYICLTDYGYDSSAVILLDANTYEEISILGYHKGEIGDVEFSKNNEMISSCGPDGLVFLWNLDKKELLNTFSFVETEYESINSVAFSNDSKYILLANETYWHDYEFVQVINLQNNEKVYEYSYAGNMAIEISKDDKIAISGFIDNENFKRGRYICLLNKKWDLTNVIEEKNTGFNNLLNNGILTIKLEETITKEPEINIYNILGVAVGTRHAVPVQNGNEIEIDLNYLNSGVYFVVIDFDGKRRVVKVMRD